MSSWFEIAVHAGKKWRVLYACAYQIKHYLNKRISKQTRKRLSNLSELVLKTCKSKIKRGTCTKCLYAQNVCNENESRLLSDFVLHFDEIMSIVHVVYQ